MALDLGIESMLISLFGNPLLLGIFVLAIFTFLMVMLRLGPDAFVIGLLLPSFIAMKYIPAMRLPFAIIVGLIIGIGLLYIVRTR